MFTTSCNSGLLLFCTNQSLKNLVAIVLLIFCNCSIQAQQLPPMGGGEFQRNLSEPCLSDEQRYIIQDQITQNRERTEVKTAIESQKNVTTIPQFIWPVKVSAESPFFHSLIVTNYVDHDPIFTGSQFGDSNLDYNCGNRTYDTTGGYNHSGIDISTWPFPWYMYENDFVEVIAAADGVIVNKQDGNADNSCGCTNFNWNAVFVEHADGSIAWYGHLKNNGLTAKPIGATVTAGEFIGYMASSGCSTDPHLHFEVYDDSNQLIDPYAGACNNFNSQSWWQSQPDYLTPRINAIKTHSSPPEVGCPSPNEVPHFSDCFQSGERVFIGFYFKDQLAGSEQNMRLLMPPNQTLYANWDFTSPNYFPGSWWYWFWDLPSNGPFGVWTVEADYQGVTYTHQFHYEEQGYSGILPIAGVQTTNRTIETDGFIRSYQTVASPAVVNYDAGEHVELQAPFEVQSGAILHAFINGCGN